MTRKANPKKTVCMPTHLSERVAEHIAREAYERGWSNSQYLRWLAILDMKRCEDDAKLMSKVSGIPRERFDLYEQTEHSERNEDIKKA
ncbi:hypothetical protein EXE25_18955 [Acinetobacter bouvetii]|uniref:Uncharacterized protein n=1 Tax=Acinetobacter bouvetii TaxID=202951 RepID=A0A4Q7AQF0_9GAMM|nr:hypothetical protein [Acinetobacter bouvetii]RZG63648.1 hypothetical protein EXE25_18955 [Acinetobacter bouvetii]